MRAHCPRQIVLAAEAVGPEPVRELIAETGEPERLPVDRKLDSIVLEHRDAHVGESAAHPRKIEPPIVVAEDRPRPERRGKPRHLGRPDRIRHVLGDEAVLGDKVAEQNDQIRSQRIGRVDHLTDVRERAGPPACRSAMTVIVSLRPAGQRGGAGA